MNLNYSAWLGLPQGLGQHVIFTASLSITITELSACCWSV